MNDVAIFKLYLICVFSVIRILQLVSSQKSDLPARLMPPPSKSNYFSGQSPRRSHYPITHLTLHPQPGNRMIAQLHTGVPPKHISSKFYSGTTNYQNDQFASARFNFGKNGFSNNQLSSTKFSPEKTRQSSFISHSLPLNFDARSLFREHVINTHQSYSPQALSLDGDLHPPPLHSHRLEGLQPGEVTETYRIKPQFLPSPHFRPDTTSTKFSNLGNREAKSVRLEENLIDYNSIATSRPPLSSKVTSIRFAKNSELIGNKINRIPVPRPLSSPSIILRNEKGFSTFPDPQIVWGKPDALGVRQREEIASPTLGDLFYPPVTSNKIIFPSDEINDVDSWKPIPDLPTLSPEDLFSQPPPKFLTSWPSRSPSTFNSDGTSHHLFVKTAALTSTPSFKFSADIGKRNARPEEQKLSPFFARFSTRPPLELEDSEYVIHLNSSERIQNLIYFLSRFLTSPQHQLPNELAILSDSDRKKRLLHEDSSEDFSVPPLESLWTTNTDETIPDHTQSSKFSNGLLDLLHLNSTADNLEVPENKERPSLKFQDFVESNRGDVRHAVVTPHSRETPQPVKINIFQDLDYFENDPFDLVHSPSISTVLGITQVSNSTNNSTNMITSGSGKSENNATKSKVIAVSAKVSKCPKLHGQADLLCEVNAPDHHDAMDVTWKKIEYASGSGQFDVILSQNGGLLTPDPRVTLLKDTPPNTHALRVIPFRSGDAGTYECEVRSEGGDVVASAQVAVVACL